MKKTILMLTMLLTGASLSGCIMNFRGSGYNYNGADKYRVFDGTVQDDFTKLDIGWISGDVTVVRGDSFGITEIIDGNDAPEYRMHYRFDGKTLKIRYAASGTKLISGMKKSLKIVVPYDLDKIKIDSVSAQVAVEGITADDVDIETVSGAAVLSDVNVHSIDIDTVSGNVSVKPGTGTREIDANTVSGSVVAVLNENSSFTAKFNSVSGRFSSEIPTAVNGKYYIAGDGSAIEIDCNTVSGSFVIKRG